MSDRLTDACPQLADLVDELVQAHLDTLEMGPYCPPLEWQNHLRYLQRLVRYAKRLTAADLSLETHRGPESGPQHSESRP
jgi:hypothetical protein